MYVVKRQINIMRTVLHESADTLLRTLGHAHLEEEVGCIVCELDLVASSRNRCIIRFSRFFGFVLLLIQLAHAPQRAVQALVEFDTLYAAPVKVRGLGVCKFSRYNSGDGAPLGTSAKRRLPYRALRPAERPAQSLRAYWA